jgi:O-antigen ligase
MMMKAASKQKLNAFVASAIPAVILIMFFTNASAKVVASVACSLFLFLFMVRVLVLRDVVFQNKAKNYYIFLLIYILAMALSLIYSPDLGDGLMRFQGQVTKLMIAVVLIETVASAAEARKYLYAGIAGGLVLSVMIVYQGMVNHIDRPGGIWNPVHAGILLVFLILLILILLLYENKILFQLLFGVLLFIHGFALYLNGTRGAWLALAVSLIVLPLFAKGLKPVKKIFYYMTGALLVVALYQTSYFQMRLHYTIDDIKQSSQSRTDASWGGRYEMWKASSYMFLRNPVFGVGLGGWEPSIREMVKEKVVTPEVLNYNQTHSIYFDVLSTRGIIGFMTFIALIAYPVIHVWRLKCGNNDMFRLLVIVITTAFLIAGATDTLVYIRGVFIFYIMLIGTGLAVLVKENASSPEPV